MAKDGRHPMGWDKQLRRWTKMYRGHRLTISARQLGCVETKEGSAQAARKWWEQKKAEIDRTTKPDLLEVLTNPKVDERKWLDQYRTWFRAQPVPENDYLNVHADTLAWLDWQLDGPAPEKPPD